MAKFRVIAGIHVEEGKVHKKGDVVTSDEPLDELFAGKFEVVNGGSPPAIVFDDKEGEEEEDDGLGGKRKKERTTTGKPKHK